MKNKIIVLLVIILAGAICVSTLFLLFKNKPLEVPAPTPVTDFGKTAKEYTLADVSTHRTKASCWTTVRGKVYDLTPWISKHPGGAAAILSLCGKDGTSGFEAQHGGQSRPENELAGFEIGVLKK